MRDREIATRRARRRPLTALLVAVCLSCSSGPRAGACTTLLVGRRASPDGSVLLASSCDGDAMGLIRVFPARRYPAETRLPMYWNVPRPRTWREYEEHVRRGYDLVGHLEVRETCRSILLGGNVESMTTGGLNEHGLTIAIEFLPMRDGLACERGVVGPNSNHWTTSLIANGLLRARTARGAIRLIGRMAERYGFLYYRAPHAGVALPIADEREAWLMEIFGPGADWTPGSGKPGAVWCAQRIPDGEVGCSANRSRIGRVDLQDSERFLASPNVISLAEELGLREPGSEEPFVWHDVYGGSAGRESSLREWRALSLVAPSLGLRPPSGPGGDRYPFSVRPDRPVGVTGLKRILRDAYEGTPYDVAAHPAFRVEGERSPLARPWGHPELFRLLGIRPERAISTPTSGYVFVARLRESLPDAIAHCLWFAYGPAATSCFVPIHAGVTDLPDTWDHPASFTRIDRAQPQWSFRLVHDLACRLGYRKAAREVRKVFEPAEAAFIDRQPALEAEALRVLEREGPEALERLVTAEAGRATRAVGTAYRELVDYLMMRHLVGGEEYAPPELPEIVVPGARGESTRTSAGAERAGSAAGQGAR